MLISFFVSGVPRAKQSFRYSRGGSYQRAVTVEWAAACTAEATVAMNGFDKLVGPVGVRLRFYLPGKRRVVDIDNLSKAVLDGIKGVVFEDDSWVDELYLHKTHGADVVGVLVEAYSLPENGS